MKKIATFFPRTSREVQMSKIGIGFECVERGMWNDTPEVYRYIGETGVKHARVLTGWFRTETEKGKYDFEWLDRITDNLLQQGIYPWFCLSYGNRLYCDSSCDDSAGYPPIFTPEARQAWKNYVAALVAHYRGKVSAFEIWNEPNRGGFWQHGPNGKEYFDLVQLTSPVIRANNPDASVIGGANGYSISTCTSFQAVYEQLELGICRYIDIYTFHRYHIHPELAAPEDYRALRKAFDTHGGKHVKLWQGESGCPSVPSQTEALRGIPVNEKVQAKVLLRSLMSDLMNGLDYTCYFSISDFKYYFRNGLIPKPNYFGILTCDDPPRRKPSYFAFQTICGLFDDETMLYDEYKVEFAPFPYLESECFSFQEMRIHLKQAKFLRRNQPLFAFWMPADLLPEVSGNPPYTEKEMMIRLWSPELEMQLKHPVLIDPISQEIFEIEINRDSGSDLSTEKNPPLELIHVPVRDYPLFLTELSVC